MPKPQPKPGRGGARAQAAAHTPAQGAPLAPVSKRVVEVRDLLSGYEAKMNALLPRTLPVARMLQLVMQEIARTPDLLNVTRNSLIGCVLQLAQLGLEPGGILAEAHLIPRNNRKRGTYDCTLLVGYRGLMKLARRGGEVLFFEAKAVRKGDHFDYGYGLAPRLEFRPKEGQRQDPSGSDVIAAWALAVLRDVPTERSPFEVFERDRLDRARAVAPASGDSPWVHWYDEMACKTVVRHLCKYLPAEALLQAAVNLDERAELGIPQELDAVWEVEGAGGEGQAAGGGDAPAADPPPPPAGGAAPAEAGAAA